MDAVDLFAGPGGWDVAAGTLGLEVVGIEADPEACETRRAAGHATVEGDVRAYGPGDFPARGLIASPPCQPFSSAGARKGSADIELIRASARDMARIRSVEARKRFRGGGTFLTFMDERTALVLEPLRWALDAVDAGAAYEWLAFEQVPSVLPVWELYAEILRSVGYSVVTGHVHAEQFGVPQSRKRAVLLARLHGPVTLPEPTHSRYHSRAPERLDCGVKPWVGMADVLDLSSGPAVMNAAGTSSAVVNPRPVRFPAATITGAATAEWGRRVERASGPKDRDPAGVRLTVAEAGVLQTFPADYPWRGSASGQYKQVGNAVPPVLAEQLLISATRLARGLRCYWGRCPECGRYVMADGFNRKSRTDCYWCGFVGEIPTPSPFMPDEIREGIA